MGERPEVRDCEAKLPLSPQRSAGGSGPGEVPEARSRQASNALLSLRLPRRLGGAACYGFAAMVTTAGFNPAEAAVTRMVPAPVDCTIARHIPWKAFRTLDSRQPYQKYRDWILDRAGLTGSIKQPA